MSATHTPGPWRIRKTKANHTYVKIDAENWVGLAKVIVRMENSNTDCQDGLANAKLIASAPDLLKERDELKTALRTHSEKIVELMGVNTELVEALKMALKYVEKFEPYSQKSDLNHTEQVKEAISKSEKVTK